MLGPDIQFSSSILVFIFLLNQERVQIIAWYYRAWDKIYKNIHQGRIEKVNFFINYQLTDGFIYSSNVSFSIIREIGFIRSRVLNWSWQRKFGVDKWHEEKGLFHQ